MATTLNLEVFLPGTAPRQISVQPPRATLGRSPSCTIALEHETISLEHAELRFQEGAWRLYQRSGRSATWVDGKLAAAEPVLLRDRGALRMGDVTIEYQQPRESMVAPASSLAETARAPVTVHATAVPLKDALAQMEPIHGVPPVAVNDMPTLILPRIPAGELRADGGRSAPDRSTPASAGFTPDAAPRTMVNPQRRASGPNPGAPASNPPWHPEPAPATQARIPRVATPATNEPGRPPNSAPETMVNPLRGRPTPSNPVDRTPRAAAGTLAEAAPPTAMNLRRPPGEPAGAGAPHKGTLTPPAVDGASRSDPPRPRPPEPGAPVSRLQDTPDPSAAERRRLEHQLTQLSTEVARLRKENETLQDAKTALEAQLARNTAGARPASPKTPNLAAHGPALLEPFAASLKEAAELLESREPERARKVLREASFQLADLRDLFAGNS